MFLLTDANIWMISMIIMFAVRPMCIQNSIFKMSDASPSLPELMLTPCHLEPLAIWNNFSRIWLKTWKFSFKKIHEKMSLQNVMTTTSGTTSDYKFGIMIILSCHVTWHHHPTYTYTYTYTYMPRNMHTAVGWFDTCQFHPYSLTHCGLVTPYGDRDLGQHWLW